MRPSPAALVLLPSLACGHGFDAYVQELSSAACEKMDDCGDLEVLGWTVQDCTQAYLEDYSSTTCEDFRWSQGQDCLDEIEATTCEDFRAGLGMESCEQVCYSYGAD